MKVVIIPRDAEGIRLDAPCGDDDDDAGVGHTRVGPYTPLM